MAGAMLPLIGKCLPDMSPVGHMALKPKVWNWSRFLIFLFGSLVHLFILFCFVYRKVTRGVFFANRGLTLIFTVSFSVLICCLANTALYLLMFVEYSSPNPNDTLHFFYWFLYCLCWVVQVTCPYFCTLSIATFRFIATCRPIRDYVQHLKASKMRVAFVLYWLLVAFLMLLRTVLGCDSLQLGFSTVFRQTMGVLQYVTRDLLIHIVSLLTITLLHYNTTKRLKCSYDEERHHLISTAKREERAAGVTHGEEQERHEQITKMAQKALAAERNFLVSIQIYVTLVTPALYLRFFMEQIGIGVYVCIGFYLSDSTIFYIIFSILLSYLDLLFVLEFLFFILTNEEFRVCVMNPLRGFRRCFKPTTHSLDTMDP